MRVEKRPVTLIELLISIGLTAILLAALLGYYQQASYAQLTVRKQQEKSFEQLYAQFRLNQIIPTILNPKKDQNKKGIYFFTKPPEAAGEKSGSLIFAYKNGTGAGSLFSNEVLGKLFIDTENQLTLLTWPIIERFEDPDPPMRKEILLTNAEDLEFGFYKPVPKDKKNLQIDPERKIGVYNVWFDHWLIDDETLPALMKIYVTVKDEDKEKSVVYAFVLTNSEEHIYYP